MGQGKSSTAERHRLREKAIEAFAGLVHPDANDTSGLLQEILSRSLATLPTTIPADVIKRIHHAKSDFLGCRDLTQLVSLHDPRGRLDDFICAREPE